MPKLEKEVIVKNHQGLHARPAALFVQTVAKYNATVIVEKDSERVNGNSIMGILTLGAHQNSKIKLTVEGEDAEILLKELEEFFEKDAI